MDSLSVPLRRIGGMSERSIASIERRYIQCTQNWGYYDQSVDGKHFKKNDASRKMRIFYDGVIADRIVDAVPRRGGLLTMSDLRAHRSEWVEPIGIDYKETVRIWEIPPNGQSITALMALSFYQQKR